jgi:lipopolysaccharide/colanic/teichoic acid biosynthesis glycosyltransferase
MAESLAAVGPIAKPVYQDDLIRGGRFLRKLSLDELLQLFDALKGSMCLVGPQPDLYAGRGLHTDASTALRGHAGYDWSVAGKLQEQSPF